MDNDDRSDRIVILDAGSQYGKVQINKINIYRWCPEIEPIAVCVIEPAVVQNGFSKNKTGFFNKPVIIHFIWVTGLENRKQDYLVCQKRGIFVFQ